MTEGSNPRAGFSVSCFSSISISSIYLVFRNKLRITLYLHGPGVPVWRASTTSHYVHWKEIINFYTLGRTYRVTSFNVWVWNFSSLCSVCTSSILLILRTFKRRKARKGTRGTSCGNHRSRKGFIPTVWRGYLR